MCRYYLHIIYILSTITQVWLCLLCMGAVAASRATIYVSAIGCMLSLRCIIALFYELLMEVY